MATQLKKRTAALWARSAMKGDDCGVYYSGRAFLSLYKPWPLLVIICSFNAINFARFSIAKFKWLLRYAYRRIYHPAVNGAYLWSSIIAASPCSPVRILTALASG